MKTGVLGLAAVLVILAASPASSIEPGELLTGAYDNGVRRYDPGDGTYRGLVGATDAVWISTDPRGTGNVYFSNPQGYYLSGVNSVGERVFNVNFGPGLAEPRRERADVQMGRDGLLYSADWNGNIFRYSASAEPLGLFASTGDGQGRFGLDSHDNLYLSGAQGIHRITPTGEVDLVLSVLGASTFTIAGDDTFYVSDSQAKTIDHYSATGQFLGVFASTGDTGVGRLAIDDATGIVYGVGSGAIRRFLPSGEESWSFQPVGVGWPIDIAVQPVIGVPEFPLLRRLLLPRLSREIRGFGLGLEPRVYRVAQRSVAWGTATILRALTIPARPRGEFVDLRSMTLEVTTECAGAQVFWLLLGVAAFIAYITPGRWPWKLAFLGAAAGVAIETNLLRVVLTAIGFETLGLTMLAWKTPVWFATNMLGIVQVVAVGRYGSASRRITPGAA